MIQVTATVAGIILIGAGIYISTQPSAPPRRVSKPQAIADTETPVMEVSESDSAPEPELTAVESSTPAGESLEAWLVRSRGRLSRYALGTAEHDQFRKSLAAILREHPAGVDSAVRTLLEDPALESAARTLLVNGLSTLADSERAESVLLALAWNLDANEAVRCDALAALSTLPRPSATRVRELIRTAEAHDAPGRAALEAIGVLYQRSASLTETQRQAMAACVMSRHAKGVADVDVDLLASTLKALAGMNFRREPDPFRTALAHSNSGVRQAAIAAASGLPPRAKRDHLIRSLSTEKDPELRLLALNALPMPAEVDDPVVEAVVKRAREDGAEHVRRAALEFFARSYDAKRLPPPAVEEVIRDRRQSDPSSVNREYAEWLRDRLGLKP